MTSSNSSDGRAPRWLVALALLALASFFVPLAGAVSPTATHIYPGPVKTGEPIAINVTIDPHSTMPISAIAYWWTSLSETRYQAEMVNSSADPMDWKGEIPAQSKPCQVYYVINITYLYYNANIGAMSMDYVYLPGTSGNYLVTVKGDLFGGTTAFGLAIGIGLMALAVGVIIYAQRLGPRWDRRYEESVKASKGKVELGEDGEPIGNGGEGGAEKTPSREHSSGASENERGGEGGPSPGRARKIPIEKRDEGDGSA